MYCIIKCIVQGKQARVKNANVRHPSQCVKKVFITIRIGKQFLTDFNTVLLLIVSQQTRHELCTDATHLKFFGKNLMARPYADAISSANSRTVNLLAPELFF